jgi:uncharacterized protein YvpB
VPSRSFYCLAHLVTEVVMILRPVYLLAALIPLALTTASLLSVRSVRGQDPPPGANRSALPLQARLAGYPLLHQQHALSCEAAAVSMATGGHLSEQVILSRMPYDPNPWLGFRGNVDRGQTLANGLANYGIYGPPLARELQRFGYETLVISGTAAPALLRYSLGVLHEPMVIWVTHYLGDWSAITGHAGGQSFTLIDGEHARLAIGYDAHGLYTLDPLDGPRYDPWPALLHSWARFGYMGLLVAHRLPHPSTPRIQMQELPGVVYWSWTEPAGPLAGEVTLFRKGLLLQQALITGAPGPARTLVLTGTAVLTGTTLANAPTFAAMQPTAVLSATRLLTAPTWYAGPLTLQVSLAQSIPYTLTVRSVDPLGLTSALAVSPVALDIAPAQPAATATPIPPPVPTMVQAAIVGPRRVRWTWPVGAGLIYRVVSYRYLGSRPVDYLDLALGPDGAFTRTVQQDMTYYAQVLAINRSGLSSPATSPIPAPVVASVRLLAPPEARLEHGGPGLWRWTAPGAARFLLRSYAYAGPHVVELQQADTPATTYRRRLIPGLTYYLQVQAVADDGERTAVYLARRGLLYYPAHAVQQLRAQRLPDGRRLWTWAAQPGVRYRLQLTRYAGSRGTVLTRTYTSHPYWAGPPAPSHTTDYLELWAVDSSGDLSAPVQLGAQSP